MLDTGYLMLDIKENYLIKSSIQHPETSILFIKALGGYKNICPKKQKIHNWGTIYYLQVWRGGIFFEMRFFYGSHPFWLPCQ